MIVISGLNDEERERVGVVYEDGELLSNDIYKKIFTLSDEKICEIFKKACYRHKQIIATLFIDEYMKGNNRINQTLVEKLNEISKSVDKDGMFKSILKDVYKQLSVSTDMK